MSNVVVEKREAFAVRVVNLYKYLCGEKKEFVLLRQLLRSGTSIEANITEAECAISKKDFTAKMYIGFKECAETQYWLNLLYKTDYLSEGQYQSMNNDCTELRKILSSITKTSRKEQENSDGDNS